MEYEKMIGYELEVHGNWNSLMENNNQSHKTTYSIFLIYTKKSQYEGRMC